MREVIFRELTSIESRKKNIFLKEIFEKDGIVARTERRSFYFIKEVRSLNAEEDIGVWLNSKDAACSLNKRQFHIFKEHSDTLGEDKVICKISGVFYAVVDRKVYTIAFLNSFKVSFVKESFAK